MATATRVARNIENYYGSSSKSNCDGDEGGRQTTSTRAVAMATRVAGKRW
jgi:hypothetical protein